MLDQVAATDLKSSCAAVYAHPAVRWLLGGELHPGGEETTRRALALAGLDRDEEMLDVAAGAGTSALLAAGELGARAVGVEYGGDAVAAAREAAAAAGLADRVEFVEGDAEQLPFEDARFDVVLCECSLCTFPDKPRAVAEMRRVLRPGGRLALSDVVADRERLPAELRGGMATIACVGEALSAEGYERLLTEAGFKRPRAESRAEDAERLARRVSDRLRGARVLGAGALAGLPVSLTEAIAMVGQAREALAAGTLGYTIFSAELR